MKYLLDTCLISELVKKGPNPRVVEWLDGCSEQSLYLSVLTIAELQKGVSRLEDDDRKAALQSWIEHDLTSRFEGRLLEFSLDMALHWGELQARAERSGEKLPVMDSLIAATAHARSLVVVTRNVRDMERCRVGVFNPWSD